METVAKTKDTLLNLLAVMAPDSSKTTLRSWVKEGRVFVDEQQASQANHPVELGQKIEVRNKAHLIGGKLRLFFQDSHLVVIEKPQGLLSVAAAFEKEETAHALVKKHYHPRKVYIVHRLDRETSGVMLFALSEQGYHGMKALFESHGIERSYCGIIEGSLTPSMGTWTSYVYEDANYVVHSSQDPTEGAIAITHYRTESVSPRYSRLILALETGRKNQIRVQCQENGHPIVGDQKYGSSRDPIKRLCLHAASLAFVHPVTGKRMEFHSPVPERFDRLVEHA